jgi:hypothetical protein
MRISVLLLCAFALLVQPLAQGAEDGGWRWDFVVAFGDMGAGQVEVEWTLHGARKGKVRVCADMRGAGRFVVAPRQVGEGGRETPLAPDEGCWLASKGKEQGPLRLRYRYDLAGLAADSGDPDYASRSGDDYIFNDEALLLRPDPLPRGAPIGVEFQVPQGISVAAPWRRLPGPGWRYRYDAEQYDTGSYVAVGRLRTMEALKVRGGTVGLSAIDRPCQASQDELRGWVAQAIGEVVDFYGTLPAIGGHAHVILAPVRSSDPGVFGTVLRRGPPSVVLFLGSEAGAAGFREDWMAVHELFHMGNPLVEGKIPWFIEGFTTYYQDVLRSRSGRLSEVAMWSDLHDGNMRHCNPVEGVSLKEESRRLRQSRRYTRVYWGGACVAFLMDVAIRERSAGKESLDTVMRALRARGLSEPLSEEDLVRAFDKAAGQGVLLRLLRSTAPLPVQPVYERLGIVPTGPKTVRLRDDVKGAAIRRAIALGRP